MKKKTLKYISIFILILGYFFVLQGTNHLADPDSFYNARMALLMKEKLVIKDFPWLQYSVLKDNYIDHHFLYHLFLIPWVSLEKWGISPLQGMAASAVVFASLMVFIFYVLLKKQHFKGAGWWTLILILTAPFVFRLCLARAPAVSIVFLLLGAYLINKKEWILNQVQDDKTKKKEKIIKTGLFLISFFYVWLYSAWLLLPVVLFFYLLAGVIDKQQNGEKKIFRNIKHVLAVEKNKILLVVGGSVAGLIINPYFPQNIKFYYHQIYQIAMVNFHGQFGVGAEWYPYDPLVLCHTALIFMIMLLISLAAFFAIWKIRTRTNWFLMLTVLFFFLYTLKARRTVEYLVPFGVWLIASVAQVIFKEKTWSGVINKADDFFRQRQRTWLLIPVGLLIFITPYFTLQALRNDYFSLRRYPFNHLQKSADFLKTNAPAGTTIFNANWDQFGFLFYYNPQNYYITGLDQTFMYAYNPELHNLYVEITRGLNLFHLKQNIRDKFNAEYILVSTEKNKKFYENLKHLTRDFELVYEDGEGVVFKVNK